MQICTLNAACGEALQVVQRQLERHKLTAEVGFGVGNVLITRIWQIEKSEASLGLELALLNHHLTCLNNGGDIVDGCAVGINPFGADVYAAVIGCASPSIRTDLAQQLTNIAIKHAIAASLD